MLKMTDQPEISPASRESAAKLEAESTSPTDAGLSTASSGSDIMEEEALQHLNVKIFIARTIVRGLLTTQN